MRRRLARSRGAPAESGDSKGESASDALDAAVDEAVERFVRVLVRRGATRRTVQRAFRQAWLHVPRKVAERERRASHDLLDASHVLTLWFSDPFYVDARGDPLPLPPRGPAPSLTSLIQHADASLNASQVLKCLLRADAVRRRGNRYTPRSRALAFRGTGAPFHVGNFRALLGMLRTLEHNMEPKDKVPAWFEYVAENPRFPVSAREPFDARLREDAMTFLRNQDSRMLSHERKVKPGERTVRIGVGVYQFEAEAMPRSGVTVQRKRAGLKRIRNKG